MCLNDLSVVKTASVSAVLGCLLTYLLTYFLGFDGCKTVIHSDVRKSCFDSAAVKNQAILDGLALSVTALHTSTKLPYVGPG